MPELQLWPGEVHVWWLFPEDVRCRIYTCSVRRTIMPVPFRLVCDCFTAQCHTGVAYSEQFEQRKCLAGQVTCPSLLAAYEELLDPEERAHVATASSAALRKERLLARVLVRTTLSR